MVTSNYSGSEGENKDKLTIEKISISAKTEYLGNRLY